MQHGICLLSVVPCRKEPSGTSEMVTQLLFGDYYRVLTVQDDWLHIEIAYDLYHCWISIKQHFKITENSFKHLQKSPWPLNDALVSPITNQQSGQLIHLTLGASLPFLQAGQIRFENYAFAYEGAVQDGSHKKSAEDILHTANQLLHAPYLWGGKSPFGIDCSGFTQVVYKLNGYKLPRDANQQVNLGEPLSFVEEAEAGDLAFFDNEEGRIVHVGILLNNQSIIHASGYVRVDKFDHYGIFNQDTGKYSHTLRVIKRLL
jgi:hypothetical protein